MLLEMSQNYCTRLRCCILNVILVLFITTDFSNWQKITLVRYIIKKKENMIHWNLQKSNKNILIMNVKDKNRQNERILLLSECFSEFLLYYLFGFLNLKIVKYNLKRFYREKKNFTSTLLFTSQPIRINE